MNKMPRKPTLRKNGSFDPVGLDIYLSECSNRNVKIESISCHLKIPMHRAIYATGIGRESIARHAQRAQA